MMLWLRNRKGVLALLVAWLSAVLCIPGRGVLVALPNLSGGPGFASPAITLIPLVPMIVYCYCMSRQNQTLESFSIRPVRGMDLILAAACILPFAINAVVGAHPDLTVAFRNITAYLALALLAGGFLGFGVAPLVPISWALAAAMGLLPLGNAVLSWPLAPSGHALSWLVPCAALLAAPFGYWMNRQRNLGAHATT